MVIVRIHFSICFPLCRFNSEILRDIPVFLFQIVPFCRGFFILHFKLGCLADSKDQGMVGVHLITAGEGILPEFYERYGFKKEKEVILMGLEI